MGEKPRKGKSRTPTHSRLEQFYFGLSMLVFYIRFYLEAQQEKERNEGEHREKKEKKEEKTGVLS